MGAGLLLRARRPDGAEVPVEISLSPLTIGDDRYTVAALRDVTQRLRDEDYLRRVLHTLDASDDGVFILDADSLRFSYVNDGAVRLVGHPRDELLTMTPLDLTPDATDPDYRGLIEKLQRDPDRSIRRETHIVHRDGSRVPVETLYQAAPVGRDETRWVIALSRDLTSRRAAERELQQSQEALHEAEQVLVVANDRERIARDLHDTVIQRLFGAGLQLQASMTGADERTRERLQGTVDDLDETIKELRSAIFALQGPGPAPRGLRGRLFDVVRSAGSGLGFEPRLQFDGAIETMDETIAEHLVAVLREALANVTRHAHATKVRVVVATGDDVVLTVTDDGVGVPDEVLGGRGLTNLAGRAEELGGTLRVQQTAEGGTRLEWRVPEPVIEVPTT
jgi:PAS domain S-box-containing protein